MIKFQYIKLIQRFFSSMIDLEDEIINCADWDGVYLQGGYPAILFFIIQCKEYINDEIWNKVFKHYLWKFKCSIKVSDKYFKLNDDENLGYIGIGFTLLELKKVGQKVDMTLKSINEKIKITLQKKVEEANRNLINNKVKISDYDVICGLSLTLRYLLNFKDDISFKDEIKQIIEYLIKLTEKINGIPRYCIRVEDANNPELTKKYKKEIIDYGMAHGISGILSTLSIAKINGISVRGQERAIRALLNELENAIGKTENSIRWPTVVSIDEYLENKYICKENYSWCYGIPGIARALHLGGQALQENKFSELSEQCFRYIYLNKERIQFNTGGICHGYSSILYISALMYKETNKKFYKEISNIYVEKILQTINKENIFFTISNNNQYESLVSIFEGILGSLLTLIYYDNQKETVLTQQILCN